MPLNRVDACCIIKKNFTTGSYETDGTGCKIPDYSSLLAQRFEDKNLSQGMQKNYWHEH